MIKSKQKSGQLLHDGLWSVVLEWEGRRKEDSEKGGKRRGVKKTVSTLVSLSRLQQQQQHLKLTPRSPTAAWKFKLGPVVVVDGVPARC